MILLDNKTKVEEVLDFLDNYRDTYLQFLRNMFDYFPFCCDMSSQILFSYIQEKFGVGQVIGGYYKDESQFHSWGKIDNLIIDFTYFQFLEDELMIEELSQRNIGEYLYLELITKYQESHILPEKFHSDLIEVDTIRCAFTEIAKEFSNFDDYLEFFIKKHEEDEMEFFMSEVDDMYLESEHLQL